MVGTTLFQYTMIACIMLPNSVKTFTLPSTPRQHLTTQHMASPADTRAQKLLEKAAQIRAELAELEGKTVAEVEKEANDEKEKKRLWIDEQQKKITPKTKKVGAQVIYLPETIEDQTRQASLSIERAFKDGIIRQTVRLALVREEKSISGGEEAWPGGAKEMYREAGRPLAEALMTEVRATAPSPETDKVVNDAKNYERPEVSAQDIWDFDGSALITARAASGPRGDVQALVFPNTDVKYLKDIKQINQDLGNERLFLLVNPFWSRVETWGFNILAPNAQKMAQEVVFDCEGGGFQETYVLSRFSVRGEDCVALKSYPYDWQLYAYIEDESYGASIQTAIRLGSSKEQPKSAIFTELLNERPEFKLNKTMRMMERNKF